MREIGTQLAAAQDAEHRRAVAIGNPVLQRGAGRHGVTAAEIATARLDAVLAGCESAGGRVLSGEGVQGLTSAFLSAGSRCVIATLWLGKVDATRTRLSTLSGSEAKAIQCFGRLVI